jgi:hypothetical protein
VPTDTPVPTRTREVRPSHTPRPPAPTATELPWPTPTPPPGGGNGDSCDLRVEDVDLSCGPGGCASWTALVSNQGDRTVRAVWTASLEVRLVVGGGWEEVEEISGTSNFRPGETSLHDRICFSVNEPIDRLRVVFTVENEDADCESHKQSAQIAPCEVGGGVVPTITHVPPVMATATNVPPTKPPKPTKTPRPPRP